MKVLVADKMEKAGVEGLKELECEVMLEPSLDGETLKEALRSFDPDVLIVRSTKVSAEVVDVAKRLSLIIRAGSGYDTIDVDRASGRGIFVANCPGKNSIAVAELAFGLLLSCDRMIPDQTAELRAGTWNKKYYSGVGAGLYSRWLGIIGLGRIANEVMTRARAFGMNVIAWSRSLTPDRANELGIYCAESPLEVARTADFITIHLASVPETKNLINREFVEAMKPGAVLVNTSRGAIIDEEAINPLIEEKNIRLGLDVYENEPPAGGKEFTNPIVKIPGVMGTHHVGASTKQAQLAVAEEVLCIVEAYKETGEVPNCVNRIARSGATHVLSVRHRNRPGVLAHVFNALAGEGINVEEVENIIYHGAEATCARVHVDSEPSSDAVGKIRSGNENIIAVEIGEIEK